ncbi:MAG: lysophospholipid acyltransferase family protein [Myxococcota bacterium]
MRKRRLLTIPGYLLAALAGLASAPLWIPALALVDLLRPGRRAALRCGLFFQFYFLCEVLGILASGALWLLPGSPERRTERLYRLEWWWGTTLMRGAMRIFGMTVALEGEEQVRRGPMLVFLRHASIADTVLACGFICWPFGIRLRYVLKRELLWDPCLDIVGNQLPNVFIDRESADPEAEIQAIAALARDLGERDGVLIYPEGTRFTPARREALLERFKQKGRDDLAARADALRHVLPPRAGGPLALIRTSPSTDVVFCAHEGFEGAATFGSLWRGALVGRRVTVKFWRVPAAEIPDDPDARERWLFDQWSRIDAWLATLRERREAAPASAH